MSYVPYPVPPRMRGSVGNPGRQPTVLQAVGLLAGLVLLLAVFAALSIGSSAAVLAVASGASGLLLGAIGHALVAHRHDTVPH